MPTINLQIKGMHCASCKTLIEEVCRDVPGVQACEVDAESGRAGVAHDGSVDAVRLKQEIEALDNSYRVEEIV